MHGLFTRPYHIAAAAILYGVISTIDLCAHATFTELGSYALSATGVSDDGSVVVGLENNGAFRWTRATGAVSLGILPGYTGNAGFASVSRDGSVVAGTSYRDMYSSHAFRWTQSRGLIDLGVLPGGEWSAAFGISGDGTAVVGFAGGLIGNGYHAFRWTQSLTE
jgi:probable HAF family extracellular repeat protein